MTFQEDPLLTPFQLRGLKLRNRIVMSPMTRCFSPGGVPGQNVADYYARRAERKVGLIITEGVGVDHPAALGAGSMDCSRRLEARRRCGACGKRVDLSATVAHGSDSPSEYRAGA